MGVSKIGDMDPILSHLRGQFEENFLLFHLLCMMIVLALQIIDRKSRMVIGRGHVLCLTRQKSFSDPEEAQQFEEMNLIRNKVL